MPFPLGIALARPLGVRPCLARIRPTLVGGFATSAAAQRPTPRYPTDSAPRRFGTSTRLHPLPSPPAPLLVPSQAYAMPGIDPITTEPFPVGGLLPKETTEALAFLRKYPDYDGRNVRVAVLDTGVDPAAVGLNLKGKVVDVIDCSGSGDIPLRPVKPETASASSSDTIDLKSPFTGRTLRVSSKWSNPLGEWKVGFKPAYDLWPSGLVSRRSAERKKAFDVSHQALLCQAQDELYAFENAASAAQPAEASAAKEQPDDGAENKRLHKEELKARVQALKDLASSYKDEGPLLEAVVFHDGKHWRAVVGGAEGDAHDPSKGQPADLLAPLSDTVLDLSQHRPMTDFREEHHWEAFGSQDLLTYSVNIVDNGNTLSLVTVAGSHGTHVAGIVGARHDEDPELNGVAPGVEIVSLKIGDSRLGSMEQGQALLRAAQALIDTKSDIANLSYGESGAFGAEDRGAFAKALRDIVIRQRDVLFISSAGNNGPALTTVGQPGGTTSGVLSVGAYVNAGAMQKAEYALVESGVPDSVTTWCSRGPCADGERGVSIYAPGAAITSIPRYCLQSSQLMNGTSMSSPNACGSIALLVSGLKARGIPVTPERVFKAVRATGRDVGDPLGVPFIRVDAAWDYLVEHAERSEQDAEFRVVVQAAGKTSLFNKRGIYLREKRETRQTQQFTVTVQPTFKPAETERAFNLELRCTLNATQPWVKVPNYLLLGGNGRGFEVRVDPTDLQPGLHHAWIEAYDSDRPGFKLFDVPVTVAKPEVHADPTVRYVGTRFESGKIVRRFVHVPEGATWASVTVRSYNHAAPGTGARFWLHCVQLEPLRRLDDVEHAFVLSLQENEPVKKSFGVRGGITMEVCSAQFWAQKAGFDLDLEIEFHGITTAQVPVSGREELTLIGGQGHAKVECMSNVRIENFEPSISFDTRRTFARPTDAVIRPLSTPRDLQPSGRQMLELVTTYSISAKEASNKLSYSFPALGNHLYDSSVPLLTQLFDIRKKRVHFGDVYKKEITLPKGDYTLKAQFLHESTAVLEKLRNVTVMVEQKLSKPKDAALQLYRDHVDLHGEAGPASYKGVKLFPGERTVLTLDLNLEGEALPKEAQPGDVLVGKFGFAREGKGELRYIVPPAPKKKDDEASAGGSAGKNENEIPELLTVAAKKIKDKKEKLAFLDKLIGDYPKYLGVVVAKLEALDAEDKESRQAVLDAADRILQAVDEKEVKLWLATKRAAASELSDDEKKADEEMEEKKKALVLALNRKTRALLSQVEEGDGAATAKMEESWKRYRGFFGGDSKDKEYVEVYIRWSILHKRYALALQASQKLKAELGAGTGETIKELEKLLQLQRQLVGRDDKGQGLGWQLWLTRLQRLEAIANQDAFAPF
ncbi:hypothetical protein ACQY0O_004026 [Thecaphora frezii]